ncbi:hypothetical protein [Roseomonas elaeocarpi]|uniref:VPXXXP-CTERM protein-sorting domain-containing protein n=1 Tax=Roseomonas elaeocarpi TaxID=907779 RepID=A0ABV6JV32_9PROT
MIKRLILFAFLLGLLVWIPMVAPHGFGAPPLLVVGLLGVAVLLTFWRRTQYDD